LRAVPGLDYSGRLFICGGGSNSTTAFSDCHTLINGVWTLTNNLKEVRRFSGVSEFPNQNGPYKYILTGGFNINLDLSKNVLSSNEVLTANGWKTVLPPLPVSMMGHCMVTINSTFVMAIGGRQNESDYSAKTFFLDLTKCGWKEGPQLAVGRNSHRCLRIPKDEGSSEMVTMVVGGIQKSATASTGLGLSSTEILEDGASQSRQGPPLPYGLYAPADVDHPDGGALLVGGFEYRVPNLSNNFLRLRHAKTSWEVWLQKLKIGRDSHIAITVPDELVNC
jgi:hypothetical protein